MNDVLRLFLEDPTHSLIVCGRLDDMLALKARLAPVHHDRIYLLENYVDVFVIRKGYPTSTLIIVSGSIDIRHKYISSLIMYDYKVVSPASGTVALAGNC